jgi:CHAT domain-containing protein/predicted negative regulator of RcsB-dependent stress response
MRWARKSKYRAGLHAALFSLAVAAAMPAMAQQAVDADAAAAQAAESRLADADTLLALTQDGAILYSQDPVKLSGYQYCSQAVALAEQGEFRQSVRAASKALHVALATNDPVLQAYANRDLAIVYSYSGQLEKAESFAQEALKYPVKDPQKVVGPVNKVLGDVQMRRGNYAAAVAAYDIALGGSSDRYAPLVRASLVNALIESGDVARARQTMDATERPADATLAAQWQRTQARLLLAENKPQAAADMYRTLTTATTGTDSEYYRMWAWDGLARSEVALGDKKAAADALGRALDGVDTVRSKFRSDEFKMGLFSDMQTVFERAIALNSDVGHDTQAFELSERSRGRALLDTVRGRAKLPLDMSGSMSLAALQQSLRPDERVVQFHSLPDRLQAWVVGHDTFTSVAIPVGQADLVKIVDGFRDLVVNGKRGAIPAAAQLGKLLVEPLKLAPGQRLIIVPHGPLHYLPFQALRVDDKYMIERHPISIAPSISIASQLAQRTGKAVPEITAFGNPRVGDEYELPGAEREVKEVSSLFPQKTLYMGAAATKTQFREAVGKSSLVHVAAHAQADMVDPIYSRILLANEDGKQSFLEAREILGIDMHDTALVTLSACESGLGRIAQGDEILGFTRSFLAAGTSSLIASLWPVSDDSAELLMSTLYGELAQGKDIQSAMQAGQLAVLHQSKMSHPFFWAPFNLIGNWRLTVGS